MNLETKCCICFSDLLMTEIVDCFVVGHWAVSHKKLTERHVSRQMTNLVDVEVEVDGYPEELNLSSKRFRKRVISSWTLAVEMVNLVCVVFCNMLVIDSSYLWNGYGH